MTENKVELTNAAGDKKTVAESAVEACKAVGWKLAKASKKTETE